MGWHSGAICQQRRNRSFSYPQAHEGDAERAVRAGLDLIARIKRLEAGRNIALATRIGIATGLVVLGELSGASGNGTAHDRAAFGKLRHWRRHCAQ